MTLETFKLLSPELILLLTGLVILIVDLIWRDASSREGAPSTEEASARAEGATQDAKAVWVPAIALIGLGAALLATLLLLGTPPTIVRKARSMTYRLPDASVAANESCSAKRPLLTTACWGNPRSTS